METLVTFFKSIRKDWPLFLFPIIVCFAFASIFIGTEQSVVVSRIIVQNRGNRQWDTLSIPVYQTMLKNPTVIRSAQTALKRDYNVEVSQAQLVSSIETKPVVHGNALAITATSRDPQLAMAIGKQVTASMYYTLTSYLPAKNVRIDPHTSFKQQGVDPGFALVISLLVGLEIGQGLRLLIRRRGKGELDV
ncbi:hypothetical protein FC99_GL001840 [Levilactobacillus koreensis JCM 16448]|uniref:Capsular polysaccharide biosynthesis protein CpsC n=1 Tax=Levilactobacillus koreensis TaxID=637971 RepID=A0AAC8ZHC8_9LACO|nr:hypothetical protein [Levilactobacillus koreensis]AKP65324.1 hypothetical protein ABN16_10120 [Levilactobacillus koreensis]KRK86093.1 hypothetical protein FC99_GL001840 [Levilactobacillus koreensis JCM 16448]